MLGVGPCLAGAAQTRAADGFRHGFRCRSRLCGHRHDLCRGAVPVLAADRHAVRPLRPPANAARHADRPGESTICSAALAPDQSFLSRLGASRRRHLRRHRHHRERLHGRHLDAGKPGAQFRLSSERHSASVSCSARCSAACSVPSTSACRSLPRQASPPSMSCFGLPRPAGVAETRKSPRPGLARGEPAADPAADRRLPRSHAPDDRSC
jgi:hypothetical protein